MLCKVVQTHTQHKTMCTLHSQHPRVNKKVHMPMRPLLPLHVLLGTSLDDLTSHINGTQQLAESTAWFITPNSDADMTAARELCAVTAGGVVVVGQPGQPSDSISVWAKQLAMNWRGTAIEFYKSAAAAQLFGDADYADQLTFAIQRAQLNQALRRKHAFVFDLVRLVADDKRYQRRQADFYVSVDAPLTFGLLLSHLRGEQSIGMFVAAKDAPDSHALVFDFDDHDRVEDGSDPWVDALIVAFSHHVGETYTHTIVRSGGGRGFHVFIVFDKPKAVGTLENIASKILSTFTFEGMIFRRGEQSCKKGAVGVIPVGGKRGIAVPCARASHRVDIVEEKLVASERTDLPVNTTGKATRERAFAVLARKMDPDDYHVWTTMAMLLVGAFGKDDTWAFNAWADWSREAQNPAPDAELRTKWDRYIPYTPDCGKTAFWEAAGMSPDGEPKPKKTTVAAKRLSDYVQIINQYKYVRCAETDDTYAVVNQRRCVGVASKEFRNIIVRAAFEAEESRVLLQEDIASVVRLIEAKSYDAEEQRIALRFAKNGGSRYVHLCDNADTVVEVDGAGWRVVDAPPVLFRAASRAALCVMKTPDVTGTLDDFLSVANVTLDELPFLLAWMVACIVCVGEPVPMCVLSGPEGSGKTSLQTVVVNALDPRVVGEAGLPKDESDLMLMAQQEAVFVAGNLGGVGGEMADALSRLITGGGLKRRTLYTNADISSWCGVRPVIINGIMPDMHKQDLISRSVVVEVSAPNKRVSYREWAALYSMLQAKIAGYVLNVTASVLATYQSIADSGSRMADYEKIGEVVARQLGHAEGWFTQEYARKRSSEADAAAEGDCVFMTIVHRMANTPGEWVTTATDIHAEMMARLADGTIQVDRRNVPGNARATSVRVGRIQVALANAGVIVERCRKHAAQPWRFSSVASEDITDEQLARLSEAHARSKGAAKNVF
jgi:hypothetical protein